VKLLQSRERVPFTILELGYFVGCFRWGGGEERILTLQSSKFAVAETLVFSLAERLERPSEMKSNQSLFARFNARPNT
jgi:hypothetical protein